MTARYDSSPSSLRALRDRLTAAAKREGIVFGRLQQHVGVLVVAQFINLASDGEVAPMLLVKGGASLELWRGISESRTSKDLDAVVRGEVETVHERLAEAGADGWEGFTAVFTAPVPFEVPGLAAHPHRFTAKLSYQRKPFVSVPIEISPVEAGNADGFDSVSSEEGRTPSRTGMTMGGAVVDIVGLPPLLRVTRSGYNLACVRVLVLGGTAMLGREVAAYAARAGQDVTCLARGNSGAPPPGVAWVRGDRDEAGGLDGVCGRGRWDVVIDVARQPGQVRRAVEVLEPIAHHYVFVSSGNVYADHSQASADESTPLLAPLASDEMADMSEYGEAKVACEQLVMTRFGAGRTLIARAGLIGGPGDSTGRSGYWPWRFAHPVASDGAVLTPDDPDLPMSIIDVRDLASWLVDAGCGAVAETFDVFGEANTLGGLLEIARDTAGHTGPVIAASPQWLRDNRVAAWMGPDSMPLWLDDPDWRGFSARSAVRARAAGLVTRPLRETFAAAAAYELERTAEEPRGCGLSDDTERLLLAMRQAWSRTSLGEPG